jgi:hypothetical protein
MNLRICRAQLIHHPIDALDCNGSITYLCGGFVGGFCKPMDKDLTKACSINSEEDL